MPMSPTGMVIDNQQAAREAVRSDAMLGSGEKFISLVLLDRRRRRVTGVEILHAEPFMDDTEGAPMMMYHFERRGGTMEFEANPARGAYTARMLDTDLNRSFLASHFDKKYWRIEDAEVSAEVEERATVIREEVLESITSNLKKALKAKSGTDYEKRVREQIAKNLDEERREIVGEEAEEIEPDPDAPPYEDPMKSKGRGRPKGAKDAKPRKKKMEPKADVPAPASASTEDDLVTIKGHGVKGP